MPIKNFHAATDPTAHENFVRWCREAPQGEFINFGPRGAMLHRADCTHLKNWKHEDWGDLATNRKLCSDDEQELLDHHLREHGEHPAKCADCY